MKKLFFVLAFLSVVPVFAQNLRPGLKAKNDGNEAFQRKDFVSAIRYWESYLNSGEKVIPTDSNTIYLYVSSFKYAASDFLKKQDYKTAYSYYEKYIAKAGGELFKDPATVFNIGFTARKLDKRDVAMKYFQKSVELNYKPDLSKLYIANLYKDSNNEAEMKTVILEAMREYPNSKYLTQMASMLVYPLLREASVPFNEANQLAKKATVEDTVNYISTMTLSTQKFGEAIPMFERVLRYDPKNEEAVAYIEVCKKYIQAFDHYKDSLEKVK
ncbi:MAG TPA: hypothetical protein PKH79_09985 [Prolixibacteraceae bacterium]|nr:hypothetical protein [Prolixibacteraceae bacterium]HPS12023.1 hypothetical protein [Prolixibacteraceae bacterium]